jgi:hypothetical protein
MMNLVKKNKIRYAKDIVPKNYRKSEAHGWFGASLASAKRLADFRTGSNENKCPHFKLK